MESYGYKPQNQWQAELGLSIRKVSNGFSIKINHSQKQEEIGRIIVANNEEEIFKTLRELFHACDKRKTHIVKPLNDALDSLDKEYGRS